MRMKCGSRSCVFQHIYGAEKRKLMLLLFTELRIFSYIIYNAHNNSTRYFNFHSLDN